MEYVVYVRIDEHNYITAVNSSVFLTNPADWVEIDRGSGDRYYHAQGNYFQDYILTEGGAYRYRLVDGAPIECSNEDIAQQEEAIKASYQPPQSPYVTWEELDVAYYEGVDSL